jgi:hypothetical protein
MPAISETTARPMERPPSFANPSARTVEAAENIMHATSGTAVAALTRNAG